MTSPATVGGRHQGTGRSGFSLPMILIFILVTLIVLYAFIAQRVGVKRQTKKTLHYLMAHYLAQGGIQHALLKLRVLPNESYDAGALARGVCPFFVSSGAITPGAADDGALTTFLSDVTSGPYPLEAEFSDPGTAGWGYEATRIRALATRTVGTERVHAIEIVVLGAARVRLKGEVMTWKDEVKKVVEVKRQTQ